MPWHLGPTNRKPRVAEKVIGGGILRELILKLPELHTVIPLGHHAKDTWRRFARPGLRTSMRTVESFHSGAQAMNQPGLRAHLHNALARAAVDWRPHASPVTASITIDSDPFGETMNHWYFSPEGDRIDIHPRWW